MYLSGGFFCLTTFRCRRRTLDTQRTPSAAVEDLRGKAASTASSTTIRPAPSPSSLSRGRAVSLLFHWLAAQPMGCRKKTGEGQELGSSNDIDSKLRRIVVRPATARKFFLHMRVDDFRHKLFRGGKFAPSPPPKHLRRTRRRKEKFVVFSKKKNSLLFNTLSDHQCVLVNDSRARSKTAQQTFFF